MFHAKSFKALKVDGERKCVSVVRFGVGELKHVDGR